MPNQEKGNMRSPIATNFLLVGLSVFFTLLIVEGGARFYAALATKQRIAEYDEYIGWRLIPNTGSIERKEVEYLVEINSKGLRDREYPYEKQKNVTRVVAIGDSFVFGVGGVEQSKLFTEVLEASFEGVEVINLGIPGFSTDQEFLYLQREGLKYRPDVVALFMFANDIDYTFRSFDPTVGKPKGHVRRDGENLIFYPPSPSLFYELSHYSYLLGYFERKFGLERYIYKSHEVPIDLDERQLVFKLLLLEMQKLCKKNKTEFITVYIPVRGQAQRGPIQEIAHELVATHDLMFLDLTLTEPFQNPDNRQTLYFENDIHLNERGHATVAMLLKDFLIESVNSLN